MYLVFLSCLLFCLFFLLENKSPSSVGTSFLVSYVKLVLVTQSCMTLCDLMDCSPPDSSVRGILQSRILEWVAIPFSRGSSQPSFEPRSPALQADSLPSEPPVKPKSFGCLYVTSFDHKACERLIQGNGAYKAFA